MEGGFLRGSQRPHRGPEAPLGPGAGPSIHGLSLVARIMRGRELAAAAAGIPPLDSEQVLDLQRSAGNRLTTGALGRWTDVLEAAIAGEAAAALAPFATLELALEHHPADLLDRLLPARAVDPEIHAAIATALDRQDPRVLVRVSRTTGAPLQLALAVTGPAGGATGAEARCAPGEAVTLALGFGAAFGPAAQLEQEDALVVGAAGVARVELPIPFAAPRALAPGLVAFAELTP